MSINDLIFIFSSDYLGFFWLVMAIMFLLFELTTPGLFFFISFAMGCLVASVFAFLSFSFVVQCIVCLLSSLVALWLLKHFFSLPMKQDSKLKTNTDALVNAHGVVIKDILPGSVGQVKVGGEIWSAKTKSNLALSKNSKIKVIRVEGSHLIVDIYL